jgi:hypothetical protein
MSFSVDIVFAGLCADVLDKPRDKNPTKLTVLMPRADSLNYNVNGYPIALHLPVLIADWEVLGRGPGVSLQDLSGRDVFLDALFDGPAAPLTLVMDKSSESYGHVVDMAYLASDFARVKDGCLDDAQPPVDVTARLTLTTGVITSHELREGEQTFPPLELPERRVAHRIRCRLSNLNSLTIRASRFDNSSDVLRIPILPTTAGRVAVTIGNLCDDDLFEFLTGLTPGAGKGKQLDYDFAAYYRLSKLDYNSAPKGSLPIPAGPDGGSGKTRCNRVEMQP